MVYVNAVDSLQQMTSPSPPTTVVTYQPTSIFQVVQSQPTFQDPGITEYKPILNNIEEAKPMMLRSSDTSNK